MEIFALLITKLIPLYVTIAMGYVAGRVLKVERESIAVVVLYMLVPIVMFSGVLKAGVSAVTLTVPFVTFCMASLLCAVFYGIARRFWRDATPNILACAAGTGNTGYFGLPVAMMLFEDRTVGIYILAVLGVTIFESSIGFYVAARGQHTAREAFLKVLKLPVVYAFLLGILVQEFHVPVPPLFWDFMANIRGAYTVLGMMIVGLGIAAMPRFRLDFSFTAVAFAAKFLAWPLLALAVVHADAAWLHFLGEETHKTLILLSIVPMAANTVVIATLLKTHPDKAAAAVLLATLVALIYVPLMCAWLL